MNLKRYEYIVAALLLGIFAAWFGFDLYTEHRYLNHPEYVHYYFPFRQWFLQHLVKGEFPIWNPYWGIGHSSEIEASFPIDIWTPLELIFGPRYSAFQGVQCVCLLSAGLWAFRLLGFPLFPSLAASVIFFLSPWVTYFFFYFIKTASFMGLLLSLGFAWRLSETGDRKWSFALSLTVFFSLFGTKVDFWFFSLSFLGIFGFFLYLGKPIKSYFNYLLALFLGIACHFWQIIPLFQILRQTDRLGAPPGLSSFLSHDFYFRFLLSVVSSPFLKTALLCFFLYQFQKASYRMKFFWAGVSLLFFFAIRFWAQAPFSFLFHPFFLGGILGAAFSRSFRSLLLFLPLSLYWCRPIPGDLNELTILNEAPRLFPFITGFLVSFSLKDFSNRLVRASYLSILMVFFLRDQGQVLMAHLFGMVWIPSRDNFLIDGVLALLCAFSLSQFRYSKALSILAFISFVLSASGNFYYSHPLIEKTPLGFPFYSGVPEIRELLKGLSKEPATRVYFLGSESAKNLTHFGSALLENIGEAHSFSSFIPKRFHDWTVYQWFGISPDEKWSSYEGEYSLATISKLPPRNTRGLSTNQVYWWSLHAMPPEQLQPLRLLGVSHLISKKPFEENFETQKAGNYWIAKVPSSLPRAFSIRAIESSKTEEFSEALQVEIQENTLRLTDLERKVSPVQITQYRPNEVKLSINLIEDSEVVLTDLFHPFWKARLDGKEIKIKPALHLFRQVRVPAGIHELDMRAEIPGWKLAWMVSILAFSVLLAKLYFLTRFGGRTFFVAVPLRVAKV